MTAAEYWKKMYGYKNSVVANVAMKVAIEFAEQYHHSQIREELNEFINWMENDCLLDDLYKDKNLTVSEYLQTCKKCGSRDKLRNGLCYGCKCLANA